MKKILTKIKFFALLYILFQEDSSNRSLIFKYFYLHDRLGSVRQVIDTDGDVANRYVYEPYGSGFSAEVEETVDNPFTFTGQWWDEEIGQYYLRARMYDPQTYRFTARDPYQGDFTEPLSLHVYLYCLNDPVNHLDPSGQFMDFFVAFGQSMWMRSKNACIGLGAKIWAMDKIKAAVTGLNAFRGGMINMLTGPSSVSDTKLFTIGAIELGVKYFV